MYTEIDGHSLANVQFFKPFSTNNIIHCIGFQKSQIAILVVSKTMNDVMSILFDCKDN